MTNRTAARPTLVATIVALLASSSARAAEPVGVTRPPDAVHVVTDAGEFDLTAGPRWAAQGVAVDTVPAADGLRVRLSAPDAAVKSVRLRWDAAVDPATVCLGDAWERAYGDLQWRPIAAGRPMPWYVLATAGGRTDGYGVLTGPAAMCCWSADPQGMTLSLDVRSGGRGVRLGGRTLDACTVVSRKGLPGEPAFAAAVAFCRQMCPHPRLPKRPVYGFNDWYCTYGKNTADGFVRDAAALAALAPAGDNRPFMVIDDGWQAGRQGAKTTGDPWDRTNEKFGSTMPEVAAKVKAMNARPGLWYRPLEAWPDAPAEWRMAGRKNALDPSNPAVLKRVDADVRRFRGWGYELLKHDFSTFEVTGQWGNKMGGQVGKDGDWGFADRGRTTAEVLLGLYRTIRDAAGDDMLVDGCDTVSHLSAGLVELQRVGDDTSGEQWRRTREMGVNCLAFRLPQNGTFYAADADCVGLAKAGAVPWDKNRQWLDLLAGSGAPLIVSWKLDLLGPEQADAVRAAFARAAEPQPPAEPLDWAETRTPSRWRVDGNDVVYSW